MKNKQKLAAFWCAQQGRLAMLVVLVVLCGAVGTVAWMSSRQGLQTLTQVTHPTTLTIKGKEKTDITQVDLSDIDLTKDEFEYIFCVVSNTNDPYQIELAHTTNIPFTYTLYPCAREGKDKYVYDKGFSLTGEYINRSTSNTNTADSTQHAATYKTYENVQTNAEPLYWLSDSQVPVLEQGGSDYLNYYVLSLTWEKSIASEYYRETDLVYLMAENA